MLIRRARRRSLPALNEEMRLAAPAYVITAKPVSKIQLGLHWVKLLVKHPCIHILFAFAVFCPQPASPWNTTYLCKVQRLPQPVAGFQ